MQTAVHCASGASLRIIWLPCLVLAALSGCPVSPEPDAGAPSPFWRSGTRLKGRALEAGGVSVLRHFRDTTLNLDCTFRRDGQQQFRCFPARHEFSLRFEDAACTQPLLEQQQCMPAEGTLVSLDGPRHCAGRRSVTARRVGAEVSTGTTYTLSSATGTCARFDGTPTVYRRLHDVPDTDFVAATVNVVGSAPLGAEVLVADDGARELVGAYAFGAGAACLPWATEPRKARAPCRATPLAYAYGEWAERTDCAATLGYSVEDAACGPARTLLAYQAADGGGFTLEGAYASQEVSRADVTARDLAAGTCSGPTGQLNQRYWRPTTLLPEAPEVKLTQLGSGPLTLEVYTTEQGQPVSSAGSWLNTALQHECFPIDTVDAGVRCLSAGTQASVFFRDSSCTTLLMAAAEPDELAVLRGAHDVCGPATELRARGTALAAQDVYLSSAGGCASIGTPSTPLYELGAVVPWSQLPELTERRD